VPRQEPQHPVQAAAETLQKSETALAKVNQDLVAMKSRGYSTASPRYRSLVETSKNLFMEAQANRLALRNAMRPAENAVPNPASLHEAPMEPPAAPSVVADNATTGQNLTSSADQLRTPAQLTAATHPVQNATGEQSITKTPPDAVAGQSGASAGVPVMTAPSVASATKPPSQALPKRSAGNLKGFEHPALKMVAQNLGMSPAGSAARLRERIERRPGGKEALKNLSQVQDILRQSAEMDLTEGKTPVPARIAQALEKSTMHPSEKAALTGAMSGLSFDRIAAVRTETGKPVVAQYDTGQGVSHETARKYAKKAFEQLKKENPGQFDQYPKLQYFLGEMQALNADKLREQIGGEPITPSALAEIEATEEALAAEIRDAKEEHDFYKDETERKGKSYGLTKERVQGDVERASAEEIADYRRRRGAGQAPSVQGGQAAAETKPDAGERLSASRAGAAEPVSARSITSEQLKSIAATSPHHLAVLKKIGDTIMTAPISPSHKAEYKQNHALIMSHMPETAAALYSAGLKFAKFHDSIEALGVQLAQISPMARDVLARGDQIGGAFNRETGVLNLDGASSDASAARIAAHEAAHAIDGPQEAISNSPEIKEAYVKEGLKGTIGEYARTDAHEFLAEALGLVYSGEMTSADLKAKMPLTYEALSNRGLIKPAEGASHFEKATDIFDKPINDGPLHADTLIRDERLRLTPSESINRFMQEESGHLDLDKVQELAGQYGASALRAIQHVRQSVAELRGEMGPRTTNLSRAAGEALARWNVSGTYARFAAPALVEKVLGANNGLEFRKKLGGVMTERRLRYMREVFTNRAFEASNALQDALAKQKAAEGFVEYFRKKKMEPEAKRAEAEVAKAREAAVEASRDSADAIEAKNGVTSIIGKPGSPFKTIDEYKAAFKDSAVSEGIKRFEQHVVPVMDEAFKRSEGMEPDDPINSFTQIPGSPINIKRIPEGQETATTVRSAIKEGNLRNEKLNRNKFARQARGNGNYDIDVANIIEHSIEHQLENAAKAEAVRVFENEGLAHWGTMKDTIDFPNVMRGASTHAVKFKMDPPPGTQASLAGEGVLHVHPEAGGEFRRALQVDEKLNFKTINAAMRVLSTATLLSTAELTYHTKNQLSFLMKPGMRPHQIFGYFRDVVMKKPEIMDRIVELARIGTMKENGMETGVMAGKYNPFKYGGKFLDLTRKVLALMGDDAYDRLVNAGLAKDTQTGRRDFINQLGQYNKQAAHKAIKFLRDTQIGPFATAGVNAPFQAVRAVFGGHGVQATSLKADLQMRAATIAKYIGVFATTSIINSAVWGMITGSDDTPFGAIRVGTSPDGRSRYIDILDLIGLKRGLRVMGLLALMEGKRNNKPTPEIVDKAGKDFVNAIIHPAAGPGVQFGLTSAFGVDARGFHTVERAQPGVQSQLALNLKAAAMHANPAVQTIFGHENKDKPGFEKMMELLGPFGIHTAARRR
jgi:hypothetical protein